MAIGQIVQSGSGDASRNEAEREWLVCQLKAAIRATWPEEFGMKRADLRVIQGGKVNASSTGVEENCHGN